MPEKFNAKNLSYASKPPPFLAALQAQAAGHGGPDPIAAGRRRPRKQCRGSEEAEDVPLVVDEYGNTVALEVDKDGVVAPGQHEDSKKDGEGTQDKEKKKEKEKKEAVTNENMLIGGRKRKVGKIVGWGEEEVDEGDGTTASKVKSYEEDRKDKVGSKKPKKKTKTIKLSFNED